MKAKLTSNTGKQPRAALKALRRAAKKAVELARLTGTPAYVLKNGRIVDAAKRTVNHNRAATRRRKPTPT